jgi:predicted RNA-binding Zn ribbon-like protein
MLIAAPRDDLCLGYVNTVTWRGSDPPTESLHEFAELLAWLEKSAGIAPASLQPLRAWAREHPKKAASLFADSIALREALFRIFSAVAAGEAVRDADFVALRDAVAETPERRQIARADGAYAWRVEPLRPAVAGLLAPVLWSAGDLMLTARERRIRRCANDKCLWLFVDASKSGTRRWCDMTSCGNRAKAQRHYAKIKEG